MLMFNSCAKTKNLSSISKTAQKHEKIYIPKNLDECFVQLEKFLKPEEIKKIKDGTEEDMVLYHFTLGMWMRNNWGLWGDSHLAKWFNTQGITHPDDMSGIIMTSFYRYLNNKPINLKEQIRHYQEYWKKELKTQP